MEKKKKWILTSLGLFALSQLAVRYYFNSDSTPTTTVQDGINASQAYEQSQRQSAEAKKDQSSVTSTEPSFVGGNDSSNALGFGGNFNQPTHPKKIPFVRSSLEIIALHSHLDLPLNFGTTVRSSVNGSDPLPIQSPLFKEPAPSSQSEIPNEKAKAL